LDELAKGGVKDVMVALPGFTADCLETLDEIGHEGRKMFIEKGGRDLVLVPCLRIGFSNALYPPRTPPADLSDTHPRGCWARHQPVEH